MRLEMSSSPCDPLGMETAADFTGLKKRLLSAQVGGCTCMTKSPEVSFHGPRCAYRLHSESLAAIERLEAAAGVPAISRPDVS